MQRIHLTLLPQTAQAEPGEQLSFLLTIENSSSLAHDVAIRVIGLQRKAYTLDKATVSIPPGEAALVHLSVRFPTDATTGRYPFRAQLTAEDDPALRASSMAELVVASVASATQNLTATEEGEAPVAALGQTDPAPSAPDLTSSRAPSWRQPGRPWSARPLVAVLGLVALLGLLGVATTRGLANLVSQPPAPTRRPAAPARPTPVEPPPSAIAAPATQQQPYGEVKGIVAHATPVTAPLGPPATATPFVITIGP